MLEPGTTLTLDVEKPAAGGRMLARHHGQIVLVSGAVPGERVSARVERVGRGVAYAETSEVLAPSPDRRPVAGDWRCGGNVFAHVVYPRQLQLKGQIIEDAFRRIGRIPLTSPPEVVGSPETGYRMRARLHAVDGRLGFYREGTHQLCDAGRTGQLLPAAMAWVGHAENVIRRDGLSGLAAVELAENITGDERACHLELQAAVDAAPFASLAEGLLGLSAQAADQRIVHRLAGDPSITDVLRLDESGGQTLRLRRDVRAFFQANRFLLERLVGYVTTLVPAGPVTDLYAGVGLFGLALAAAGAASVTLVEGDATSGADLTTNAAPFGGRAHVEQRSVEAYLRAAGGRHGVMSDATVIVDPPRTGMSKDALAGVVAGRPRHVVYVSCDVATLARDCRILLDAGYMLGRVTGFDLFPNTAHVETVAQLSL